MEQKIIGSRFDPKRPFDALRAEDLGEDLYEFYAPLENLIRKVSGVDIKGSRSSFLIGGRGTGKTMFLKFLSLEMQLKDHIKRKLKTDKLIKDLTQDEILGFLESTGFIGLYLHFRSTEYDSITGEVKHLFGPYLSMKISEQFIRALIIFKQCGLVSEKEEKLLVNYFLKCVNSTSSAANTLNDLIDYIRESFLSEFELIFEKNAYYTIEEIKKEYIIPSVISAKLIYGFPQYTFSLLKFLEKKSLFIMLDELEFLDDNQLSYIGKLIKDSDETPVIFKIGSRNMPAVIPVGSSGEVLQETDDFRRIDITDSLNAAHSGKKTDYENLIKEILNTRLRKSDYFKSLNILNINYLFPPITIEEEAIALVKGRGQHWASFSNYLKKDESLVDEEIRKIIDYLKYPSNPVIEKLNMLLYYRKFQLEEIKKLYSDYLDGKEGQYKTLYQKNALNLLFQLYSDYRPNEKKYVGIDVFIHLSSGVIRNAIELCNSALNTAYNYGFSPNEGSSVGPEYQDRGVKNYSKLQYERMQRIKKGAGLKVQELIKEIGSIFRKLHLNRYLVEPEPTHFEINYSELTGDAKEIFDAAINYSCLQEKTPMEPKSKYDIKNRDFILNRIYAPWFKISYRVRGRTFISADQITRLIEGSYKEKEDVRKEIIINNIKKNADAEIFYQKNLSYYLEQEKNGID